MLLFDNMLILRNESAKAAFFLKIGSGLGSED